MLKNTKCSIHRKNVSSFTANCRNGCFGVADKILFFATNCAVLYFAKMLGQLSRVNKEFKKHGITPAVSVNQTTTEKDIVTKRARCTSKGPALLLSFLDDKQALAGFGFGFRCWL